MNRLLASLPNTVTRRLLRNAEQVEIAQGTVLHASFARPRWAYFPLTGVCSVVTRTYSGHAVETCMLGDESCSGATYLMGHAEVPSEFVQQVAGVGLRIPFVDLQAEFRRSEPLRDRILELVQVWSLSMAQLVACQRLHRSEQRLARWLLMVRQRSNSNAFQLSHEFLAEMLGCGRPNVTQLLLEFREAGLVESERTGYIEISDPAGLEASACECHAIILELYAGLYKAPAVTAPTTLCAPSPVSIRP